jgi:hypothetical protein
MLDPFHVLENWLNILERSEHNKNILFSEKDQTEFSPGSFSLSQSLSQNFSTVVKESFLKFFLPDKTIETLFWKFLRIKRKFMDFYNTSHLDLLKEVEPHLSEYYEQLLGLEEVSPLDRFLAGFGKLYDVSHTKLSKKSKGKHVELQTTTLHTLITKFQTAKFNKGTRNSTDIKFHKRLLVMASERQQQFLFLSSTLNKETKQLNLEWLGLSPLIIQDFLLDLDFSRISQKTQLALFTLLATNMLHSFQILSFKNAKFLDLPTLVKILGSQHILYNLILINCSQLNQPGLMDQIVKTSPNLLEVWLEGFKSSSLTFLSDSFWNFVYEPQLEHVTLKNCEINQICANLPKLIKFQMLNCATPTQLKIWADMDQDKYKILRTHNELLFIDLFYHRLEPSNTKLITRNLGIFSFSFSSSFSLHIPYQD